MHLPINKLWHAFNLNIQLNEVEKLITKLKLPGYIVEILKNEPLEFADGIIQCEDATDRLSEIIKTKIENGLSEIAAVKERISLFQTYGNDFATRLSDHLSAFFKSQADGFLADESRYSRKGQLKLHGHESFEEKIYRYRKLLVWLKGIEARKFRDLELKYTQEIGRVYTKEIHILFEQLRQHHIQKVSLNQEYLFVPASSVSAVATNAISAGAKNVLKSGIALTGLKDKKLQRKEEIMKGDASKKALDADRMRSSVVSLDVSGDDKISPEALFGETLAMLIPVIVREQNVVMDLFGFRSQADVKSNLKDWQEDLANRFREPVKDVKQQRMIQFVHR